MSDVDFIKIPSKKWMQAAALPLVWIFQTLVRCSVPRLASASPTRELWAVSHDYCQCPTPRKSMLRRVKYFSLVPKLEAFPRENISRRRGSTIHQIINKAGSCLCILQNTVQVYIFMTPDKHLDWYVNLSKVAFPVIHNIQDPAFNKS